MAESNSSGALAVRHDQDAYGIVQASWSTGLPASASARAGWHHNTKNTDPDTGLVYMYQRWYLPETGTFLSKAPRPTWMEHGWGFALNAPPTSFDPDGEDPWWICTRPDLFLSESYKAVIRLARPPGPQDKFQHCLVGCWMGKCAFPLGNQGGAGASIAAILNSIWELNRGSLASVDGVLDTAAAAVGGNLGGMGGCAADCEALCAALY